MGILIDNQNTETTEDVVNKIKRMNTNLYNMVLIQHTTMFNYVWNNKKYTAKEILDGFGTDAVTIFQLSGSLQQMLSLANPNYVPMTPLKEYTINQDGTVTVAE
jgi:hypothetical protein